MGVYIISILRRKVFSENERVKIRDIVMQKYPNHRIEVSQFIDDSDNLVELDIDIHSISFTVDDLNDEYDKLIEVVDMLFSNVQGSYDIIGGYNDTNNAIQQYKTNIESNYRNWNLFATKLPPSKEQYYALCNGVYIFQSFKYDGLGILF